MGFSLSKALGFSDGSHILDQINVGEQKVKEAVTEGLDDAVGSIQEMMGEGYGFLDQATQGQDHYLKQGYEKQLKELSSMPEYSSATRNRRMQELEDVHERQSALRGRFNSSSALRELMSQQRDLGHEMDDRQFQYETDLANRRASLHGRYYDTMAQSMYDTAMKRYNLALEGGKKKASLYTDAASKIGDFYEDMANQRIGAARSKNSAFDAVRQTGEFAADMYKAFTTGGVGGSSSKNKDSGKKK
jgi:hypothetical protein